MGYVHPGVWGYRSTQPDTLEGKAWLNVSLLEPPKSDIPTCPYCDETQRPVPKTFFWLVLLVVDLSQGHLSLKKGTHNIMRICTQVNNVNSPTIIDRQASVRLHCQ